MGRLTQPGDVVDLRPVFTALYRAWVAQAHGSSLAELAGQLQAQGARLTRTNLHRLLDRDPPSRAARQPPFWLLLWLCEATGMVIEISPDGIRARAARPEAAS